MKWMLAIAFSLVLLNACSSPSDVRPGQCHPCTVSAQVGPLLKDAQQMIAARNYEGAKAKLNEAEAVKVYQDLLEAVKKRAGQSGSRNTTVSGRRNGVSSGEGLGIDNCTPPVAVSLASA